MLALAQAQVMAAAAGAAGEPREWVALGMVATFFVLIILFAVADKIRATIGSAADPRIAAHNDAPTAHPKALGDIHRALEVLNGTVISLQRQIDTEATVRRDALASIQRQLELAIELLEPGRGA